MAVGPAGAAGGGSVAGAGGVCACCAGVPWAAGEVWAFAAFAAQIASDPQASTKIFANARDDSKARLLVL